MPDGRLPLIRVLLTALLLVTAGCLSGDDEDPSRTDPDPGPDLPDPGEPISAKAAEAQALAWAQEVWQGDAETVMATAIQAAPGNPALQGAQASQSSSYRWVPDEDRTDGLASVWILQIWSQTTEESRTVSVTEHGTGVFDHRATQAQTTPQPVTGWTVDSTEAMALAIENETFLAATQAEDAMVVSTLGYQRERPTWQLQASATTQGKVGAALIDAVTGQRIDTTPPETPEETPEVVEVDASTLENSTFHGQVNASEPAVDHGFRLANLTGLTLNLTWELDLPEGTQGTDLQANRTLTVQLLDNGTVVPETPTAPLGNATTGTLTHAWHGNLSEAWSVVVAVDGLLDSETVSYSVQLARA